MFTSEATTNTRIILRDFLLTGDFTACIVTILLATNRFFRYPERRTRGLCRVYVLNILRNLLQDLCTIYAVAKFFLLSIGYQHTYQFRRPQTRNKNTSQHSIPTAITIPSLGGKLVEHFRVSFDAFTRLLLTVNELN